MTPRTLAALFALALLAAAPAGAQQQPAAPPAAAEREATENNWNVAIAIVDSGGHAAMVHRLDSVQIASIRIAEGKARTALEFRRPTKALEDTLAAGGAGMRLLSLDGVTALEGGVPIQAGGRIIGAIGVSGVTSQQDAQIARAGAEAAAR